MNSLLILSPLGMILVGLLSIVIWKMKKHISIKCFLFGGLVWAAAIIPKLVMDYTLTPLLNIWVADTFGLIGVSVIIGAYVGLRTGLFECGFTFLTFSESSLKRMSLDEVTAFGIGFGAFEAIIIALPTLIQITVVLLNPSLLDSLPPLQRQMIEAQLSMPTWVVPAPIIERVFTLFAHLFSALLIFNSIKLLKVKLFLAAFIYKSLLDAVVPYIQVTLQPSVSPGGVYLAEIWVAMMGFTAVAGIYWARKNVSGIHRADLEKPVS